MKCKQMLDEYRNITSPPSRVAWIEIDEEKEAIDAFWSPPSRVAWIEITEGIPGNPNKASPPSRVAWIEITYTLTLLLKIEVAALTGGVD